MKGDSAEAGGAGRGCEKYKNQKLKKLKNKKIK